MMVDFNFCLAELTRNGQAILALANEIDGAQASWRPSVEAWSILEVINHLDDEEREDFRQRIDYVLHRPGAPWPPIHPGEWVTTRGYNERDLEESLARFRAERERSLMWLVDLGEVDWEKGEIHPLFGRFTAGDLLYAWVTHDHLHLRQLVELKRAYLAQAADGFRFDYAGDW